MSLLFTYLHIDGLTESVVFKRTYSPNRRSQIQTQNCIGVWIIVIWSNPTLESVPGQNNLLKRLQYEKVTYTSKTKFEYENHSHKYLIRQNIFKKCYKIQQASG